MPLVRFGTSDVFWSGDLQTGSPAIPRTMDFANLPGFDIEADLAPLTNLQSPNQNSRQGSMSIFQFGNDLDDPFGSTSPEQQQLPQHAAPTANGDPEKKVFFITNCGSLLGRTIAQVALERGHCVAACAREKHLADLNVRPSSQWGAWADDGRVYLWSFRILVP
jgi:hypothetical protein